MKNILAVFLLVFSLSACGQGRLLAEPGGTASVSVTSATSVKSEALAEEEIFLKIKVGENEFSADWEENSSAQAFQELLEQGPLTVEMSDYGGFEKVGSLGLTLERNDTRITAEPGDVILYQGNQITIYYGTNTWDFTRLAKIQDPSDLQRKLGQGRVEVTFSLGGKSEPLL